MHPPTILAIETATEACSVAIVCGQMHAFRYELAPRLHTKLIFPMIQSLLNELSLKLSDLNAIAVGQGPGSFTGVRIAISCAQGLSYGLGIPVFPISTLEALKAQVVHSSDTVIIPSLDARMGEVYVELKDQEMLCCPALLAELISDHFTKETPIIALGSGWDHYQPKFKSLIQNPQITYLSDYHPRALEVARIAHTRYQQTNRAVSSLALLPQYIRNEVAQKSK